jgi:DNA-binding transcriptional ArsR family regulator
MSERDSIPDDAYEALEGLCENPTEHVAALASQTPDDAELAAQETVFKALANEKRLRILAALRESERCVCELQGLLDAPQSTVASHLRTLKDAGLVASRKNGKWRHYRIADTAAIDLLDLAAAVDTGE